VHIDGANATFRYCDMWSNAGGDFWGLVSPVGTYGNLGVDPGFEDPDCATGSCDFHLANSSALVDAGDPTVADPDGSVADMGLYGGADGGGFDLDGDGYFSWWQPGPYDFTSYPALGWDCDDLDAEVYPGAGC